MIKVTWWFNSFVMSASPEQQKAAEAPKEETPKEEKKAEAPKKFAFNGKFGGHLGKISPKAVSDKKVDTDKDTPVDDSTTEAPSTAAEQVDPDVGEEKLFEDKAVLYRFDATSKEWKERGQGYMKVLKSKENGKCRILMRRAQTFKICANHYVLPHMEIKPNQGSDRALIWNAVDFADGTESHDTLSVRFKSPEVTNAFKAAFEKARKDNEEILKNEEKKE